MHAPSARTRKVVGLSAAPLAVLAAGLLVWQGSMAAFTATTDNSGNNWDAGHVALTDNDDDKATFTAQKIVPNQTDEKFIEVTSDSNVPGQVRLYAAHPAVDDALADHIVLDIVRGNGNESTFVADPETAKNLTLAEFGGLTGYDEGITAWDITGSDASESATYRISWKFDTGELSQTEINKLQGGSAQVDFVWELQNTEPSGS